MTTTDQFVSLGFFDHCCLFLAGPSFFPGFHGGVQEAVLSAGGLPRRPVLHGVSVLREGGGGEVLQSPEQDLQGERAEWIQEG